MFCKKNNLKITYYVTLFVQGLVTPDWLVRVRTAISKVVQPLLTCFFDIMVAT